MDPSAVSKRKLAFWAAAFAVGAYLGYKIAEGLAMSGLAVLSVIVGALLVAAILVSLAVIAVIAALQPGGRSRSTASAMILAGVVLIAGLGTGWLFKEIELFGYRPSVVLEAPGTMTMSLDGIDGYAGNVDSLAACRSEPDAERVAFVEANAIGRIGTGTVGVSVVILPQTADDRPAIEVWIVPEDKTVGPAPSWRGPAGDVAPIDGGRGVRTAFTGAALAASDETGLPPEGWPAALSGTIQWRCGGWLSSPSAQP